MSLNFCFITCLLACLLASLLACLLACRSREHCPFFQLKRGKCCPFFLGTSPSKCDSLATTSCCQAVSRCCQAVWRQRALRSARCVRNPSCSFTVKRGVLTNVRPDVCRRGFWTRALTASARPGGRASREDGVSLQP